MSEKLKELAKQAGFDFDDYYDSVTQEELERFAELVRQDEANGMRETYMKMIRGAVLEEREACAKLCEAKLHQTPYGNAVAAAIRARGETSSAFKNYMGDNWAGIV